MVRSALIAGLGMYVPEKIRTNEEIEQMLKRPGTAKWLVENVGVRKRHIMADNEVTSDLALHASRQALENAGIEAEELDLIILSTDTPDYLSPGTSAVKEKEILIGDGEDPSPETIILLNETGSEGAAGGARSTTFLGETRQPFVD